MIHNKAGLMHIMKQRLWKRSDDYSTQMWIDSTTTV